MSDLIALQNAEFEAARVFAEKLRRCLATGVVDDGYQAVRHEYEQSLRVLLDAVRSNTRNRAGERKVTFLESFLECDSFMECDTCRNKAGSPVLCSGCLNNRAAIIALEEHVSRLTKSSSMTLSHFS